MAAPDPAKAIKTALAGHWTTAHPAWTATLHVDDDFVPTAAAPVLLVADDGGPRIHATPWALRQTPTRPTIRLTAFAVGRDAARVVVEDAAEWIQANRPPEIARIENVLEPVVTRDRATGAYLAFITMPVIVRPA